MFVLQTEEEARGMNTMEVGSLIQANGNMHKSHRQEEQSTCKDENEANTAGEQRAGWEQPNGVGELALGKTLQGLADHPGKCCLSPNSCEKP